MSPLRLIIQKVSTAKVDAMLLRGNVHIIAKSIIRTMYLWFCQYL